ncbi:hypothetical protein [Natrinema salifodinae]|uniref:hypothetical protein n=1 Tax=Natrinema salifodinae TaxID=1202768 RepID=UPI001160960C|nr:hypothetical protein [Natrinema salifodinae]
MGSNEQGEEELVDSIDESEHFSNKRRINRLRTACIAYLYSILYQTLVLINAVILQVISIVVLIIIDFLAPTVPTVTFSPLAIQVGGEGLPITITVIIAAAGIAAKRVYQINTSGYPEIEIKKEEGEEDD